MRWQESKPPPYNGPTAARVARRLHSADPSLAPQGRRVGLCPHTTFKRRDFTSARIPPFLVYPNGWIISHKTFWMQNVIWPKQRRRLWHLTDFPQVDPKMVNKTPLQSHQCYGASVWVVANLLPWHLELHGQSAMLGTCSTPWGDTHNMSLCWGHTLLPLTANALLLSTYDLETKKTTCIQSFYRFGHCDQTLLPILWNCDKSLGIKQHGDHRGYDVYCAEQTVIIH